MTKVFSYRVRPVAFFMPQIFQFGKWLVTVWITSSFRPSHSVLKDTFQWQSNLYTASGLATSK